MDEVPYSLTDSVVGIWVINMVTRRRHLIGVVRKRSTCKSGCRGWDTWFPILVFLRWSLDALADGHYPERRHDGQPFNGPRDEHRRNDAGGPLRFKGAVLQLRGDWAEYCERYGFPTHNHTYRPCFLCATDRDRMHDPQGWL